MDDSSIEDTLDSVLRAFRGKARNPERGLEVDSAAQLQLAKACRLLGAIHALRERNGYYTIAIEASFGAIERTVQFHLQQTGYVEPDEFVDHRTVYDRGLQAGLYGADFRDKLVRLWENNRSRTYYREGVGTEERAELMLDLAEGVHAHVLQLAGRRHDCSCGVARRPG